MVQGFLHERAKGARTHGGESPTHHLNLTSSVALFHLTDTGSQVFIF